MWHFFLSLLSEEGEERIKQEAMVKESFEGHYWEKVNAVLRKRVVMV